MFVFTSRNNSESLPHSSLRHRSLPEDGKIPLLTVSKRDFSSSVRARIPHSGDRGRAAGEKQVMKAH